MTPVVRDCPAGAKGIDCITRLTATTAAAIRASGVTFAMRYLPLAGNPLGWDLTLEERDIILGAGLGLGAVQHVRKAGLWTPSTRIGMLDGAAAVANALAAGLMPGMTLHYDMEGPIMTATWEDVIDYDRAWTRPVVAAGFVAGGYFGYGLPGPTASRLWDLSVTRYWKSGSDIVAPANCGWALEQLLPFNQTLAGVPVDYDECKGDALGRFPGMLWADDTAAAA
jgi:Domain of unknown function (DUF1906)